MHKNKKQKRERGAIIVEATFSNNVYFTMSTYMHTYY